MVKKFIIVFDLDGTLIQSSQFMDISEWDFIVNYYWDDTYEPSGVRIKVRQGAYDVLNNLSVGYNLALFSHSYPEYISQVLEKSRLSHFFLHVLNNFDELNDSKDLRVVLSRFGYDPLEDLDKIIIVDDNNWCLQKENVFLIESYDGGKDNLFNHTFTEKLKKRFKVQLGQSKIST